MTVNNSASREAQPSSLNLATDVMGASKLQIVLRNASSGPPILMVSSTVIGVMLALTASPILAQSATERTANGNRAVQPQVLDFSVKNRQKAESKQLLQDARNAVTQGQAHKARGLIKPAAELPMNRELGEKSSQNLIREIDVLTGNEEAQHSNRSLTDIPTISELAEPALEDETPTGPTHAPRQRTSQRQNSNGHTADVSHDDWSSRQKHRSATRLSQFPGSVHEEPNPSTVAERRTDAEHVNANGGREYIVLHATSNVPPVVPDGQGRDSTVAASAGSRASQSASSSEQTLVNFSTVVLSALFGAVVVLVGVLLFLLKKFGPNPTIVFKVEMSNTGHVAEPADRSAPPALRIAPIYAMKMQEDAEREQQQEEAMMQKVFEDNLELREQLKASGDAA